MKKPASNLGITALRNHPISISMVMYTLMIITLSGLPVTEVHAQAIFSGPAFGQIAGGVQVSTTTFE